MLEVLKEDLQDNRQNRQGLQQRDRNHQKESRRNATNQKHNKGDKVHLQMAHQQTIQPRKQAVNPKTDQQKISKLKHKKKKKREGDKIEHQPRMVRNFHIV